MKLFLCTLIPSALLAMDHQHIDVRHGDDHVIIDLHEALQIPATPRLSPLFDHPERLVSPNVQVPQSRIQQVQTTVSNNKLLIISNITTAIIGATVTLIVHFTAS